MNDSPTQIANSHAHEFDHILKKITFMFRAMSYNIPKNIDQIKTCDFYACPERASDESIPIPWDTTPGYIAMPYWLFVPRRCPVVPLRAPTKETPPCG